MVSQKDVTLNWDSEGEYFSFHYTDTPEIPSSPDKDTPAVNHSDWATVKLGDLWVKGEKLETPVSVLNALNVDGVLFTNGTNKMLGDVNVNRNNVNDTTIAYIDEIRITERPIPLHLDLSGTDPTTLDIYSDSGAVSPAFGARSLLISPDDYAYVVLGEDGKSTGVKIGQTNSLSKIVAGWDDATSLVMCLFLHQKV